MGWEMLRSYFSIAGLAAVSCQYALAQQPDGERLIEEVMVTAQKRESRLLDAPISITAVGQEDIEHRGLVDRNDYLRSVPGVNLVDQGPGLSTMVIRGAYGEAFNTGPTVGVYLADVPLTGYALGSSTDVILSDIERVEVLRGPQGTLYGSNSLSGTVRYIPRAPDLTSFEGQVEAGYSVTGRHGGDNARVEGVVNVPVLTDKLGVRAVLYRHENDGFYKNIAGSDPVMQTAATRFGVPSLAVNKDHVGGTEYQGGRVAVLWQPFDKLGVTLTYLKQKTAQENRPFEQIQYGPYELADYQFGGPGAGEDALSIDLDIISLSAEFDAGWGSFVSSSAWIDQDWTRIWDIGSFFPGRPPVTQLSDTKADVFAQEVRFASAFSGPFQVIGGLYYEDSDVPYRQPTYYVGAPAANPWTSSLMWDSESAREVTQEAAFGEASYSVTEALKFTVGGRSFEYETRFLLNRFNSVVPSTPNSFSDVRSEESNHTLKAGVELKVTRDALIYAGWSEGFRLGRPLATAAITSTCDRNGDGLIDNTSIRADLDRVSSDTLESYELGAKFGMLEGRGSVSLAVYSNDWTDIPVNVSFFPACLASTTVNGGSARARGAELESAFRVLDSLRLSVGVGYVDSYLTSTTSAGNDGDRMNYTPEWNGMFSAEYTSEVVGRPVFLRGDYTYFGNYYTGTGERGAKVAGYGLANLNAGITFNQLDLQVQASNIFNSDSYTTIGASSASGGFPGGYALRVRPRTVGLRLAYKF